MSRYSVEETDTGYYHYQVASARALGISVRLDGVVQDFPITADDVQGLVVRLARDKDGHTIIDVARQRLVDEVAYGKVEIELFKKVAM